MLFVILYHINIAKGKAYCDGNRDNDAEWNKICSETCGKRNYLRKNYPFPLAKGDVVCFTRKLNEDFAIPKKAVQLIVGKDVNLTLSGVQTIQRKSKNSKNILVNRNVTVFLKDPETSIFNLEKLLEEFSKAPSVKGQRSKVQGRQGLKSKPHTKKGQKPKVNTHPKKSRNNQSKPKK